MVTVTTKAGKSWQATVAKVVWTDGTATLVTTRQSDSGPSRRRPFRPCGYPGCNPGHCDECDGEGYIPGR